MLLSYRRFHILGHQALPGRSTLNVDSVKSLTLQMEFSKSANKGYLEDSFIYIKRLKRQKEMQAVKHLFW